MTDCTKVLHVYDAISGFLLAFEQLTPSLDVGCHTISVSRIGYVFHTTPFLVSFSFTIDDNDMDMGGHVVDFARRVLYLQAA